jgi:hypothetical protein
MSVGSEGLSAEEDGARFLSLTQTCGLGGQWLGAVGYFGPESGLRIGCLVTPSLLGDSGAGLTPGGSVFGEASRS